VDTDDGSDTILEDNVLAIGRIGRWTGMAILDSMSGAAVAKVY